MGKNKARDQAVFWIVFLSLSTAQLIYYQTLNRRMDALRMETESLERRIVRHSQALAQVERLKGALSRYQVRAEIIDALAEPSPLVHAVKGVFNNIIPRAVFLTEAVFTRREIVLRGRAKEGKAILAFKDRLEQETSFDGFTPPFSEWRFQSRSLDARHGTVRSIRFEITGTSKARGDTPSGAADSP